MTTEAAQLALVATKSTFSMLQRVPFQVLALTELAATYLANEITSLLMCFNVQLHIFLTICTMLTASNGAHKEFTRVQKFMALESLHVRCAVATHIAEHLFFRIVHQHVVAQALFPFECLATVWAHMRRFHRMLWLMDQQSSASAEAIVTLQAEEGLAQIRAVTTQV